MYCREIPGGLMQRLVAESRIEYSQEADLPVHGAVFWISTENAVGLRILSNSLLLSVSMDCSVSEGIRFGTAKLMRPGRLFCGVRGGDFQKPFETARASEPKIHVSETMVVHRCNHRRLSTWPKCRLSGQVALGLTAANRPTLDFSSIRTRSLRILVRHLHGAQVWPYARGEDKKLAH